MVAGVGSRWPERGPPQWAVTRQQRPNDAAPGKAAAAALSVPQVSPRRRAARPQSVSPQSALGAAADDTAALTLRSLQRHWEQHNRGQAPQSSGGAQPGRDALQVAGRSPAPQSSGRTPPAADTLRRLEAAEKELDDLLVGADGGGSNNARQTPAERIAAAKATLQTFIADRTLADSATARPSARSSEGAGSVVRRLSEVTATLPPPPLSARRGSDAPPSRLPSTAAAGASPSSRSLRSSVAPASSASNTLLQQLLESEDEIQKVRAELGIKQRSRAGSRATGQPQPPRDPAPQQQTPRQATRSLSVNFLDRVVGDGAQAARPEQVSPDPVSPRPFPVPSQTSPTQGRGVSFSSISSLSATLQAETFAIGGQASGDSDTQTMTEPRSVGQPRGSERCAEALHSRVDEGVQVEKVQAAAASSQTSFRGTAAAQQTSFRVSPRQESGAAASQTSFRGMPTAATSTQTSFRVSPPQGVETQTSFRGQLGVPKPSQMSGDPDGAEPAADDRTLLERLASDDDVMSLRGFAAGQGLPDDRSFTGGSVLVAHGNREATDAFTDTLRGAAARVPLPSDASFSFSESLRHVAARHSLPPTPLDAAIPGAGRSSAQNGVCVGCDELLAANRALREQLELVRAEAASQRVAHQSEVSSLRGQLVESTDTINQLREMVTAREAEVAAGRQREFGGAVANLQLEEHVGRLQTTVQELEDTGNRLEAERNELWSALSSLAGVWDPMPDAAAVARMRRYSEAHEQNLSFGSATVAQSDTGQDEARRLRQELDDVEQDRAETRGRLEAAVAELAALRQELARAEVLKSSGRLTPVLLDTRGTAEDGDLSGLASPVSAAGWGSQRGGDLIVDSRLGGVSRKGSAGSSKLLWGHLRGRQRPPSLGLTSLCGSMKSLRQSPFPRTPHFLDELRPPDDDGVSQVWSPVHLAQRWFDHSSGGDLISDRRLSRGYGSGRMRPIWSDGRSPTAGSRDRGSPAAGQRQAPRAAARAVRRSPSPFETDAVEPPQRSAAPGAEEVRWVNSDLMPLLPPPPDPCAVSWATTPAEVSPRLPVSPVDPVPVCGVPQTHSDYGSECDDEDDGAELLGDVEFARAHVGQALATCSQQHEQMAKSLESLRELTDMLNAVGSAAAAADDDRVWSALSEVEGWQRKCTEKLTKHRQSLAESERELQELRGIADVVAADL
eukprot:TRINITY_DN10863_c0_g1_i1.p1 TRINITY_DN10863_c0_g1~~TRINITY_DN10863_c0_g1_i1.p1  ORF type:complete len:1186 (+),score=328.85 TRINITY_DN10863_c0_g1_i1:54-3611(+)